MEEQTKHTERKWYMQWWVILLAIFLILVVFKIFSGGSGEKGLMKSGSEGNLKEYDGQVVNVTSEEGGLEGTVTLEYTKTGSGSLRVYYNLYLIEGLAENKVCFTCQSKPEYNGKCRSFDKYNYAGLIWTGEDKTKSSLYFGALPVFCDEFIRAADTSTNSVPRADAMCINKQVGKDSKTSKFYFSTMTTVKSYEELVSMNKFDLFDAKEFMTRDSCVDGKVGSSLEAMDSEGAIQQGESFKSYNLVFESMEL